MWHDWKLWLQRKWNDKVNPPKSAGYHGNIDISSYDITSLLNLSAPVYISVWYSWYGIKSSWIVKQFWATLSKLISELGSHSEYIFRYDGVLCSLDWSRKSRNYKQCVPTAYWSELTDIHKLTGKCIKYTPVCYLLPKFSNTHLTWLVTYCNSVQFWKWYVTFTNIYFTGIIHHLVKNNNNK
jgi:hypothetical protein